jgi:hypothetical protein
VLGIVLVSEKHPARVTTPMDREEPDGPWSTIAATFRWPISKQTLIHG